MATAASPEDAGLFGAVTGVPPGLEALRWVEAPSFLGPDGCAAWEDAAAVVLPVPYEATTSWGAGTRLGPRHILEASGYVELYDREAGCEPATRIGIHTLPALELSGGEGSGEGPGVAMTELQAAYHEIAEASAERFLVMLGGEHSITSAAVLAQAARHADRLSVLQLDAHADLRGEYEGTPYSHACAMARVLGVADVVGVGVRGVSQEEVDASESSGASTLIWADELRDGDAWMDRALEALGPKVYLSVDVDYFDPALVPATGTPEPGGGDWYGTMRFLRRVLTERHVVAADVVELAPIPGLHASDFFVAKLVYKLISYRFMDRLG